MGETGALLEHFISALLSLCQPVPPAALLTVAPAAHYPHTNRASFLWGRSCQLSTLYPLYPLKVGASGKNYWGEDRR